MSGIGAQAPEILLEGGGPWTFRLDAPENTEALGAALARRLEPGALVLLSGPLGAGKTTLVRGLLRALGWDAPVRSPTFNLMQTFPTDPPVLHVDLYRLESDAGLGWEEYLGDHVCLIEWPERLGALARRQEHWHVELSISGEGRVAVVEWVPAAG